jgi:hypothetical protein
MEIIKIKINEKIHMFKKFRRVISNVILKIISNFKNIETFLEQIDYSSLRNKI